ncbi:MAG: cytochrome c, partial [Bacteroidota bacterium]
GGEGGEEKAKPTVKVKQSNKKKEKKEEGPSEAVLAAGKTVFTTYCIVCHGADGKMGLNGAKDLTASELTRDEMITQVTKGKGAMAAYESILKPDEIEAVVDYVRSMKGS